MSNPSVRFPIGKSDFASVRQGQYEYVDKSLLISEVIEESAEVLLFPRPRRFGKTLNLSMLKYFFEKPEKQTEKRAKERRDLFTGLQIEQEREAFTHFQKYPVIFLTLKDVKASTWEDTWVAISEILSHLYEEHAYLLQGSTLSPQEYKHFNKILNQELSSAESFSALGQLCKYLHDYHQEKVVILIDEYDTCIHSAYLNGYYEKAIEFFRNFLSGGLKDNPNLFKGVVTGILRIARESMFSGLNNLAVYSLLRPKFATSFGFTEAEVKKITHKVGHPELLQEIKIWYNGYLFGEKYEIYNPWSILNFLDSENKKLQTYWVNTGSVELINQVLFDSGIPTQAEIEILLQGGEIEKPLEENVVLRDLNSHSLWSFLLFSGYLKATQQLSKEDLPYVKLAIPNREIRTVFLSLSRSWFEAKLGSSHAIPSLLKALFSGDAEMVEEVLNHLMKVSMSYLDIKADKDTDRQHKSNKEVQKAGIEEKAGMEEKTNPENVYHAFVLGLVAHLGAEYEVRSNRESGYGRPDLMLLPKQKGKPGVVLEFKVAKKSEKQEAAMKEALQQLDELAYETELKERSAYPILEYAAVFLGKKVKVQLKSNEKQTALK